ncbi:MAG: hypothetical protein ACLQJR_00620 [Stellaceae bacterium]
MPHRRQDADYLRAKAAQFRELALQNKTLLSADPLSAKMIAIAEELEAKAAEIEKRPDPRRGGR